jgi:WD40 repeat protein
LSFSPDTKRLAVAQSHLLTSLGFPSVELWDVETGRSILQFDAPKGQLHSVQFSPNGKILAAGHSTGALILMRSYPWEWNVTQRSLSQHVATYSQVWQSRYLLEPCPSELFQFQAPHNAWQKWPARPAKATSAHIDLTRYYNAWLDVAWSPLNFKNEGETHFAELKPGMHKFGGVDFDLRGIVQLSGQANDWRQEFPLQVALPVHGLIAELHFLQGTYFWNPQGTQPGHYVVHYGNGEQQVIAIQVGKNVSPSWGALPGPWSSSNSVYKTAPLPRTFASPSSPAGTRGELCLISWTNPTPQLAVTSVTFHSTSAGSAPFLAALTIKEADAKPLQTH